MEAMTVTDRLPTSIDALDRKLDGGLPPGSLVLLSASPASQSEQFLSELTAARQTLVLTTRRPQAVVERTVRAASSHPENVAVREVDGGRPLGQVYRFLTALEGETNVIIDPLDPLERADERQFIDFLNAFRARLTAIDSVGVLHCLCGDSPPPQRDLTTYMSDVVFDLSTDIQGDNLENRLAVPKFRGGRPFEETVRLDLADGVGIDTSRDIG